MLDPTGKRAPGAGPGVWLIAALVGAAVLGLVGYELLRPRDLYTGTNQAGTAQAAATIPAGRRFCIGGLEVPAGSGRVEVQAGATPVATTVDAVLRAAGSPPATGRAVAAVSAGPRPLVLVLTGRGGRMLGVGGTLCLIPRQGPISLWGRLGLQANQVAPTLDGVPQPNRVPVWFRPPVGERHSLLSQLPAMTRRAALFRPGIVGPWTYWAILLATPLLAVAGIALLSRAVRERPLAHEALAIGAIAFALAGSWALISPVFNAPDEAEHIAYAQTVAENGRAPETDRTGRRAYSSELQLAFEGAQLAGFFGQSGGRPPWSADDERRWAQRQSAQRPSARDGGGINVAAAYSPLYYAALAPAYLAAGDHSIWSRITAMRFVSALLGAIAAAAVFLLVRELAPRQPWAATAAGLLVAFQPMFSFMSGAVNNDAAVNAAGAILLLALVVALRRGMSIRLALGIGVVLAILPLAKGNGFFLYPAAAAALIGVARRRRPGPRPFAALVAAFAIVCVVWVPLSRALHHDPLPTNPGWHATGELGYPSQAGAAVSAHAVLDHPGQFASYLWEEFLPPLPGMRDVRPPSFPHPAYTAYVKRGWASFGFLSINFPGWVYAVIATALAAAALLAVATLVRERSAVRTRGWELAVLALAALTVWIGSEAVYFAPRAATLTVFGRYLFVAAAALAVLAVGACFGAGRRRAPLVASVAVVATMGLQWASQLLTMSSLYA